MSPEPSFFGPYAKQGAGPANSEHSALRQRRWLLFSYFLLGAGLLAPWNAFITAADYYSTIFPGYHMDRLLSVCYLPVCLLWLGVTIRFPVLMSPRHRILWGFGGFTAVMLFVPLLDAAVVPEHGSAPGSVLAAVLLCVVGVGLADGMAQAAMFGEAGHLPQEYMQALVSGTASSGLLICLLRLATKAALMPPSSSSPSSGGQAKGDSDGDDGSRAALRISTRIYFTLSGVLSLACFVVYGFVLPRNELLRKLRQAAAEQGKAEAAAGAGGHHGAHGAGSRAASDIGSETEGDDDDNEIDDPEAALLQEERKLLMMELQLSAELPSLTGSADSTRHGPGGDGGGFGGGLPGAGGGLGGNGGLGAGGLGARNDGGGHRGGLGGGGSSGSLMAAAAAALDRDDDNPAGVSGARFCIDDDEYDDGDHDNGLAAAGYDESVRLLTGTTTSTSGGAAATAAASAAVSSSTSKPLGQSHPQQGRQHRRQRRRRQRKGHHHDQSQGHEGHHVGGWAVVQHTLRRLWRLALAVFLTYVVTLAIFPGVLAEDVHSQQLGDWYPLLLITAFNAADLAGKSAPPGWPILRTPNAALVWAVARTALVPAFLVLEALQAPGWLVALTTIALGASNGYVTSQSMLMVPNYIPQTEAGVAESLLVFSLVAGLNVGAYLSWLWVF